MTADMAAGAQGQWVVVYDPDMEIYEVRTGLDGNGWRTVVAETVNEDFANRIARIPEMEACILAQATASEVA